MVELSRLNGDIIFINSDLIKYVESRPDTLVTFVDGKTLVVKEAPQEVARRVREVKKSRVVEAL